MEDGTGSAAVESGGGEGEHAGERDRLGSQQQPQQHQQQQQQGQKKRQLLEGDAGRNEGGGGGRPGKACTRCRDSKTRYEEQEGAVCIYVSACIAAVADVS